MSELHIRTPLSTVVPRPRRRRSQPVIMRPASRRRFRPWHPNTVVAVGTVISTLMSTSALGIAADTGKLTLVSTLMSMYQYLHRCRHRHLDVCVDVDTLTSLSTLMSLYRSTTMSSAAVDINVDECMYTTTVIRRSQEASAYVSLLIDVIRAYKLGPLDLVSFHTNKSARKINGRICPKGTLFAENLCMLPAS